ncbi:MAG: LysR family transcriptional regulator [Planctomycetes bacterium]|nr:LysR family transcriptional regulator [Planctomycetota bacterium]
MKRHKQEFDLWQTRVFAKVAETGSFSKAAESLLLSQPTVSEHIAALETTLGARLLDRRRDRVRLTPIGTVFLPLAQRMLRLREEARAVVQSHLGVLKGHLTIGGSTIPGTYVLPEIIGRFARKYPGITVTLRSGDSREILHQVQEGSLEIGMVGSCPRSHDVQCHPYGHDVLQLVMPRRHPLARHRTVPVEALAGFPFLQREPGSGSRELLDRELRKRGHDPARVLRIVCELGSTEAVKEAIKSGLGVSVLSRRATTTESACGLFAGRPIEGLKLERPFYVVTPRSHSPSPAGVRFLQILGVGTVTA